jgi:hypothetical protein
MPPVYYCGRTGPASRHADEYPYGNAVGPGRDPCGVLIVLVLVLRREQAAGPRRRDGLPSARGLP